MTTTRRVTAAVTTMFVSLLAAVAAGTPAFAYAPAPDNSDGNVAPATTSVATHGGSSHAAMYVATAVAVAVAVAVLVFAARKVAAHTSQRRVPRTA